MKVIVGLSSLELGGSMISAIELAASVQDQLGWEMAVYAPPGPASKLLAERGLRHIEAPGDVTGWSVPLYRNLRALDRLERPDVFHAWDWALLGTSYYAMHLRNRPVMGSCTAMSVPSLLPWALPISFVTEEIRVQDQRRRGPSYLQEYPINVRADDPATVDGAAFRTDLGVGPDQTLLVVVSRLARWMKREGIARTIEVTERLARDHDVVLAVVGDGDARAELEALGTQVNQKLGRDVVRFTGAMVDPRPAYAAAQIGLGMGTSIVRGMAFGVPAIVLGEEGFSAIFDADHAEMLCEQGFYGLGVAEGANDRLEAQLLRFVNSPDTCTELGQFCRQVVQRRFSVDVVARELAERYRIVASAPIDRSRAVLARAARDLLVVCAATPARRLVPDQIKFKLQRRHTTRQHLAIN
ncbi:MAG: glycosyltransferase family 4 protein [Acidimicrobiales bacterium]